MDAIDFLVDENGDEALVDGDLLLAASDEEHIQDILISYPGEWKQFPFVGVNITRIIRGSIDGTVRRDIRLNLTADGYRVGNIIFNENELKIDAERNG